MAGFTRVNGDFLPVAVYDDDTGNAYTNSNGNVNAMTSGVPVQPQGPALEFFTITGNGSQLADYATAVFQSIEQLATIHLYQYTNATDDTLAIGVYPVRAWTTTSLDTAITNGIQAANSSFSANVSVANGATFS
jgi:hypothetical protein